jgi:hypothetical protein
MTATPRSLIVSESVGQGRSATGSASVWNWILHRTKDRDSAALDAVRNAHPTKAKVRNRRSMKDLDH